MLISLPIRRIRFVVSFFLIIILNLVNTLIQAQENTQSEVTNQVWIDFNPKYKISESFDLRGGILYDSSPVKDEWVEPSLPDASRWGFNIGFGYKFTPNLVLDLAYMYLRFDERTIENSNVDYTSGIAGFNGVYNSSAHLLGINLSYYLN